MIKKVGIVGLGAMGSAMAIRLTGAGYRVAGTDIRQECRNELNRKGGTGWPNARQVAEQSDIVITSLASVDAFKAVIPEIATAQPAPQIVVDASTLDITDKTEAAKRLEEAGIAMLDCTVSGNRDAVLDGSLSLYGSGDEDIFSRALPVLNALSKTQTYMGEFGNACRIKYILNFLVVINNAATAEAMTLATKSGLDLKLVYKLVCDSYANSAVFEQRGKKMIDRDYVSARGTYGIARKDSRVISDFARAHLAPTPVFHAALQMHLAGMAEGYTENDTASLYEVYLRMAGAAAIDPQLPLIAKR